MSGHDLARTQRGSESNLDTTNTAVEPARGSPFGFIKETYGESGAAGCARLLFSGFMATVPPALMRRRTTTSVSAYFDTITADAVRFFGDDLHFGYFEGGDEGFIEAARAHTDLVARMAGIRPGMRVLDVGCGVGSPALRIAETLECDVVAVNISRRQVDLARRRVAEKGLEGTVSVERRNALSLPYPDASFDAVICLEVAGDICVDEGKKGRLADELFRLVKPGGSVGFSDLVFHTAPDAKEDRILSALLHHAGKELMTDWAEMLAGRGFRVAERLDILAETMPTWAHTVGIYERRADEINRRYGRFVAKRINSRLQAVPSILERLAAYPVLSLKRPEPAA